jgi:hypothetical protein
MTFIVNEEVAFALVSLVVTSRVTVYSFISAAEGMENFMVNVELSLLLREEAFAGDMEYHDESMPLKAGVISDNLNFPSFVTINDFSTELFCSIEKSPTFWEIFIDALSESVVVVVAFNEEPPAPLLLLEDDEDVEHGSEVDIESTVHDPEEHDVWEPQLPEVHRWYVVFVLQ